MSPYPSDPDGLPVPAAGAVVEEGRGALPFQLIHGESLVATAAWAAGEAGIDLVDLTVPWQVLAERGDALLLHDALCPMTPPDFLARCADRAVVEDLIVVGVRPVTDSVKQVQGLEGGELGASVDRDALVAVCSPVVLPPAVVADLLGEGGTLPTLDFVDLVAGLRRQYGEDRIELVEAPPEARRVGSTEDIVVLEALTDAR